MVKEERIKNLFIELARFDSESFYEKQIGEYVVSKLRSLGLAVDTEHTTSPDFLAEHPESHPNIFAKLEGNISGEPVLFSAHLDTVSPGNGKKAIVEEDGKIHSAGGTVLGADDISGIVSIMEALAIIGERKLPHPDIEVLITPAEEPFCEGARFFNYELVRAKMGYVLDLTGPVGTAAQRAPSILSFNAELKGKAAHAGFTPEEGINALNIAVQALGQIPTGHVDPETTVNIGTISGGMGKNIVPESIILAGEVRSLDHERANRRMKEIIETFNRDAKKAGGLAACRWQEHIRAFSVSTSEQVVQRFKKACEDSHLMSRMITTFGGSDGNRLNEAGIRTIVLSCGMEKVHTTSEYTSINELKKSAALTVKLMTVVT